MTVDHAERDKVYLMHALAMQAIGMANMMMLTYRPQYEELIEAERQSHNIAPTLFLEMIDSKLFPFQLRLVRAALAFLREFAAVADEQQPAVVSGGSSPPVERPG